MKKIFYEKVGRRYVPVSEYDSELAESFTKGAHLIMSYPGGSSTRYNINPAYAPLIAACRVAEDAMTDALYKASEMVPKRKAVTKEQQEAWLNLQRAFDDDMFTLQTESARGIVGVGVKAMVEEASKILNNPSAKLAYEHFLLVAELTKDNVNED